MSGHLVVLAGMVTDLIASVSLPIVAFQNQDARPISFEAGASANVMIAAARLGLRVSALGALGEDPAGQFLREVLRFEGIDIEAITLTPGSHSPLTLALIDHAAGQHVFIGHVGDGQPVAFSQAMRVAVEAADAIFWHGYCLHETQNAPIFRRALELARSRSIPIFFDSGPTLKTIPYERTLEALRLSSIVKMTADELPLAANGLAGTSACDYLLELGLERVIITLGRAGCTLVDRDGTRNIPGYSVPLVDTVGAGDPFSAGYLCGLLAGWPPDRCARLANALGAAAVQKRGAGRNVPTRAEVEALLELSGAEIQLSC